MTQSVPYPVAKLAAEAGFDELTDHRYDTANGERIDKYHSPTREARAYIRAPYPADLVDWLWRKWKVWMFVERGHDSFWGVLQDEYGNEFHYTEKVDDPHTALLSALEAGLRWVCENKKT